MKRGHMLCVGCVEEFPESERHGSYCHKCYLGMTKGIVWKEEPGPAPKEEEMEPIERIAAAADAYMAKLTELEPLHTNLIMAQLNHIDSQHDPIPRTAERRAVARDAYMAALGGLGAAVDVKDPVGEAVALALETVRRWDAFLAAVDAEGGE